MLSVAHYHLKHRPHPREGRSGGGSGKGCGGSGSESSTGMGRARGFAGTARSRFGRFVRRETIVHVPLLFNRMKPHHHLLWGLFSFSFVPFLSLHFLLRARLWMHGYNFNNNNNHHHHKNGRPQEVHI